MDPEERLYTALGGGKPDRIPSFSLMADPNILNQALGREPSSLLGFIRSDLGRRYIDRRAHAINRYFKPAMFFFGDVAARANYRMGYDSVWLMYWPIMIRNHAQLEDAFGRLFDIVDDGHGNPYFMYRGGQIESPGEWRKWPRPSIAGYARISAALFRLWRRIWRGRIAVVPFFGPGLWENGWQPMGFSRFVVLMRKDPDFVREVAGYFTALGVATVDAFGKAGARVIGIADDLAYKSGPMISPEQLEEFYGEGYRQMTATAHRHGARVIIHCCGNTGDLLEKFVEWGFDGAHAFEPTAGNDLAEARRRVGDRLCLIGNIDVTRTLVDATREEVEEAVRKAVRDAEGGGFVLAPAHAHADINVQSVRWMLQEARRL